MNRELRITNYVLRITLFALLLLVGCGAQYETDAYVAVASWLDAHALPSERVAMAETLAQHFDERPALALLEDADAVMLLATLHAQLPDYVVAWPGMAWDGVRAHPWFREHYRFLETFSTSDDALMPLRIYSYSPSPFDLGEWRSVEQSIGGTGLELRAVRVNSQRLIPGDPLYVTLSWRGDLFALPDAQRLALRLVDADGGGLRAQVESAMVDGLLPDLRRDGDEVTSRYILAVPEDLSYGDYALTLTLYQSSGESIGSENLRLIMLSRPPDVTREPPVPEKDSTWFLGDAVALIGYDVPERVAPGDAFRVMLYWHALAAVPGDYTVFIHLLDANGAAVVQADGKPVWWTYPTTQWEPDQYIRDEHILELDADMPRGDYTLSVGLYDAQTGTRLDVTDAQGASLPDGRIDLGIVKVR
ncbi:MAG: hypothetical protein ACK2UI_00455 [Anaerolineae bacterium]